MPWSYCVLRSVLTYLFRFALQADDEIAITGRVEGSVTFEFL